MRKKILLLLASPTSKGVDDGHFKTSVFLLSTEIRNSCGMGRTLVPELLGLCNHGTSSHKLGLPQDFASFASEMDVSEVHLVNLQYICFTGKMYVAHLMSTLT